MRTLPIRAAFAVTALAAAMPAAQRWETQYFYDQAKSSLAIADLAFGSASRGVAVGAIVDGKKRRPAALATADGGAHWETVKIEEMPVSLFFLNESLGWMVTEKGIWQTEESGKSWRKLPSPHAPVLRVFFTDEKHGWAVCAKKTVLETQDGGQSWTKVKEAEQQPGEAKYTVYSWVVFATAKDGIITGWNAPPDPVTPRLPGWIDPEPTLRKHERPHLMLSLESHDGGKTWKSYSTSSFGLITRVRYDAHLGMGMGLIEYGQSFLYPSEIYRIGATGKSETFYRDRKFAVSDIWLAPDGTAYAAGAVYPGPLRVVPGRVQVLKTRDFKTWSPMDVDYRATANRTIFAVGGGQMWLATDTGMILKLAD